jgi:hypothetical protein
MKSNKTEFTDKEITNKLLSKFEGKRCFIRYTHYSHHNLYSEVIGIIKETSPDKFMVCFNEAASAEHIFSLKILD